MGWTVIWLLNLLKCFQTTSTVLAVKKCILSQAWNYMNGPGMMQVKQSNSRISCLLFGIFWIFYWILNFWSFSHVQVKRDHDCTHATELVLLFAELSPVRQLKLSQCHVAELKYFRILRQNSNPQCRITSMEVDGPDRATTMLHENFNAVHHLTSSLIWTNNQKILKNPQDGFF